MDVDVRDEEGRLRALDRMAILDSAAEPAFDELAKLAAHMFQTPTALITLVDDRRQWFKARVAFGLSETPRELAFCSHTILGDEVLVVPDARRDPRFQENPYVRGDPHIRFYAGAPLVTDDGHAVGSLAIIDYVPRELTAADREALRMLSHQVVAQLELRARLLEARRGSDAERARMIERFEMLARATNDVAYDWDLRTDSIWWSESFTRIYGDPSANGRSDYAAWKSRVHPDDAARVDHSLQEVIRAGGTAWSAEYRFRRADDSYAHIFERGYIMRDRAGVPVRMIGAMTDLSERIELEQQVIRAQRMQAIGQLAGGIAHDFNNVLTAIECNAYLLARGGLEPSLREHVAEITDATERAATLTRQLLLVGRKQAMRRTTTSITDIVGNMSRMLRRVVGEHIELRVETAAVPMIDADVSMIEQVVLNLVLNARDAMPAGGELRIRTGVVQREAPALVQGLPLERGTYATLSVADTGPGVAPDALPHIFEPFYTTKEVGKGSGLGLSTVFAIARQHQGAIDVSSRPGHGATFTLYLPTTDARLGRVTPPIPADHVPFGGETLLVVEDEPAVRAGVTSFLQRCGYQVIEAPSAVIAAEIWALDRDRIDLVLTDLVMPGGMTGRELAAHVRQQRPDIPVVFTSGYPAEQAYEDEPLVDGENYLAKPYAPSKLAQLVRRRLDQSRRK